MSKSVLRAANWVKIASCQFGVRHRVDLDRDVRALLRVLRVREVLERLRRRPLEPEEAERRPASSRASGSRPAPSRRRRSPRRRRAPPHATMPAASAAATATAVVAARAPSAAPPLVPRCIRLLLTGGGFPSHVLDRNITLIAVRMSISFHGVSCRWRRRSPRRTCSSAGAGGRPRTARGSTSATRPTGEPLASVADASTDRGARRGRRRRSGGRRRGRRTRPARARRAAAPGIRAHARPRGGDRRARSRPRWASRSPRRAARPPTPPSSCAGSPRRPCAPRASTASPRRRHPDARAPPAGRRLRADHAVELPRRDGDAQARAGARGRLHRDPQARRRDAAHRAARSRRCSRRPACPPGVVNVIPTTRPREVVAAMVDDPRVRKLSFTGSTEVGRELLALAARRVVNVSMELGRQRAVPRARRRRRRRRGRGRARRQAAQRRRGVHGREPLPRPRVARRALHRAARRRDGRRPQSGRASTRAPSSGPMINEAAVEKIERARRRRARARARGCAPAATGPTARAGSTRRRCSTASRPARHPAARRSSGRSRP